MSKQLIARPRCACDVNFAPVSPEGKPTEATWYLCGVCYPLIKTLPEKVMASTPTNAALLLFQHAYPDSKDAAGLLLRGWKIKASS